MSRRTGAEPPPPSVFPGREITGIPSFVPRGNALSNRQAAKPARATSGRSRIAHRPLLR